MYLQNAVHDVSTVIAVIALSVKITVVMIFAITEQHQSLHHKARALKSTTLE